MQKIDKLIDTVWSRTSDHPTKGRKAVSGKKTVRLGIPALGTGSADTEYTLSGMMTLAIMPPSGQKIEVFSDCIKHKGQRYPVSFRSLQRVLESAYSG
jgi:hypothetical protein